MILPFENDNLKIIRTLASRSLKASRFRNMVAVLAIALTTVLFTSVTTIGLGAKESLKLTMQVQKMSKSDADIRYLSEAQYEKLVDSGIAQDLGLRMPIGFLSNAVRHNTELDLADSVQQELTFCQPSHGEEAKAANEIVASDKALIDLGVEPEVGASVTIEFTAHGNVYSLPMVVSGWYESTNSELSVMTVSKAFKEAYPEIFEYTYLEDREMAGTYWADFTMKNKNDMQEQLDQLVETIGGSSQMAADNYISAVLNKETNPGADIGIMAAFGVLAVLFMLCGYLLIYNVFDIAVMQEIRRYGLYRTIGMSKKQIRFLINKQAVWVAFIGIPIGLLAGFWVGKITLPKVMGILATEYTNVAIQVSPSPIIFIGAALLAVLTVYISTRKPIRMASTISPMEAFRYVECTGKKQKLSNQKTKKQTRGISLWRMALANMGRNKRRSVFIIISLMLSIMMLDAVGTAAGSLDTERQVQQIMRTDFEIAHVNTSSNLKGFLRDEDAVSNEAIWAVKAQKGVEEGSIVYKNTLDDMNVTFDFGKEITNIETFHSEGTEKRYGALGDGLSAVVGTDDFALCSVFGMERDGLARLDIREGETDFNRLYQKLSEGSSVILGVDADRKTGKFNEITDYLDVGDTITSRIDGNEVKTYTIIAKAALTSDDGGYGYSTSGTVEVGGDAPYLYLPQEEFKNIYQTPAVMKYTFNVKDENKAEMEQFLETYMEQTDASLAFLSAKTVRENAESTRAMIYMVGGIIAFIFGITGVLNLVNMMSTSILARRREFATMQSIGMTKKQMGRLLMLEGFCYAAGAAVLGIVFSVVINETVVKTMLGSPSMWFFTYQITLAPAAVLSLVLLLISLLIPRAAMGMLYKGSVVEQLRAAE